MGIFVGQMQPFNGIGMNDQFGVVGPPMDITNGGRGSDPIVPLAPTLPTPEPVSRETKRRGGSQASTKSLERRRRMAEALMGQGMDTSPISSPWQGAARLAQALAGGLAMRRADQEEQAGQEAANAAFMSAVQGGKLDAASLGAMMGNPYMTEGQQALATKLWQDQQPKWETFTNNAGDVMRYNVNDPNSQPETFYRGPPKTPEDYTIGGEQTRYSGATGKPLAYGEDTYQGYLQRQKLGIAAGIIPPNTIPKSEDEWMEWQAKKRGQTTINVGPTGIDYGAPEKGLVWARDPQTNQIVLDERGAPIAIPYQGGPAFQKQQQQAQADQQRATAGGVVVQDIDRALEKINQSPWWTTGVGGSLLTNIPGTEARNVAALMDTVKANAGFDRLQQMRNESPTGGALGQVSEREIAYLQATIGNLEQSQDAQQLKDNLIRVQNAYLDIIHGPGQGPPRKPLSFEQGQPSAPQPQPQLQPQTQPQSGQILRYNPQTGEIE